MSRKIGIVAFAFGAPENIYSNKIISEIVFQKAVQLRAPVFTQHEIAVHINSKRMDLEYKETNEYLSTFQLARYIVEWAKKREIEEILLVAAEPHLQRCIRDVTKAFQEKKRPILIRVCKDIFKFPRKKWFCAESRQIWTRSRLFWLLRETILRLLPFSLYKIVVS